MRQLLRKNVLVYGLNAGLVAGLGLFGCGEAHHTAFDDIEPEPNGTVGTLHARIASFEDGHAETYYRMVRDNGEEIALDFGNEGPIARVGQRIAVRGPRSGNRIEVDAYDLVRRKVDQVQQPLRGPMQRTFRVAGISLTTSMAKATYKGRIFTDTDSPNNFYQQNSYGNWSLTGDVYGPYTITIANCNNENLTTILADAQKAAKADGLDPANYDNFMVYMPTSAGCSWGGIAEVGVTETKGFQNGTDTWYNSNTCVVYAQELGHNFGLLHSHLCTGSPYSASAYGGSACPGYSEYGDQYTPMGGGCGHFNAPEMGAQQFITGCNTIDVKSTGTFEVGPIEKKCDGPQVLRVATNTMVNKGPGYIYAEYRAGKGTVGTDTKSNAGLYFHASADYGGNDTGIIPPDGGHDADWAVDPFWIHAPLTTANSSWTEPVSGATFTLNTIGATASVNVTVPSGTGAPTCAGGGTPPAAPVCGGDGGTPPPPDGGTGGSTGDAATDVGKDGTGTGGTAGAAGSAGTGGTAGTAGTGGTGGTAGTAGTAGTGGSGGTAGKGGTGGSSGSGGSAGATGGAAGSGTGGSAGATGGSAGAGATAGAGGSGKGGTGGSGTGGSTTTGGNPTSDDSGCGCRVPGRTASTHTPAWMLGLAALLPVLRRRRSRAAKR